MSKSEVPIEFVRALNELGLSNASSLWGTPLTGGVSSDIWRIETEKGMVCAKRALSKLRVNADWYAPVERNLFEARWLQVAHQACVACAPELLGQPLLTCHSRAPSPTCTRIRSVGIANPKQCKNTGAW
jgi:hypothetical protein